MEVDERPTEQYSDIGGLDKQIQEVLPCSVQTSREMLSATSIHSVVICLRPILELKELHNNNRLFTVYHLVRAQSTYKDLDTLIFHTFTTHTCTQKERQRAKGPLWIAHFLRWALPKCAHHCQKKPRGHKPVLACTAVNRTPAVPLATKQVSGRNLCSDFTFGTIPDVLMTVCMEKVFSSADLCFAKTPGTPVYFQVR